MVIDDMCFEKEENPVRMMKNVWTKPMDET